jgi:hypothetical protein
MPRYFENDLESDSESMSSGDLLQLRSDNDRMRIALEEIWKIVAPGAYEGVNYCDQISRIKGICELERSRRNVGCVIGEVRKV